MKPIKVYQGKTALWYYMVIATCIIMPLYLIFSANIQWIAWLVSFVILLLDAFLLATIVNNRIEVYETTFVFHYGFSKKKVELKKIKALEHTHSPLASSANSLDRIYIDTGEDELCMALKDNDGFIQTIHELIQK